MKSSSPDDSNDVTIYSYIQYFTNMWILGIKMMVKALVAWIMICLMFGFALLLFKLIASIPLPSDQTRDIVSLLAFGLYCLFVAPLAFYVGGSTVGFCPWISAATFTKNKRS